MLTIVLPDSQATKHLGYLLGKFLPAGSVILLDGDLGAGKTTLVQGIAQGLNISEAVVSPTFTLINEYTDGRLPLYHLDLYRLATEEVEGIYPEIYWEGMEVAPGITAIEWQQRLAYQPSNYIEIKLVNRNDNNREAKLRTVGKNRVKLDFLSDLTDDTTFKVKRQSPLLTNENKINANK